MATKDLIKKSKCWLWLQKDSGTKSKILAGLEEKVLREDTKVWTREKNLGVSGFCGFGWDVKCVFEYWQQRRSRRYTKYGF